MSTPNPLRLVVLPSRWMISYLALLHGLVLVSLAVLSFPWPLTVFIVLLLFFHYRYWLWRKTAIDSDQWIEQLIYTTDQQWQLLIGSELLNARLHQATIWPQLILLNFVGESASQTYSLVLFPDSANADQLRQLRVILRHQAF